MSAEKKEVDFDGLFAYWREYAAIQSFGDWDDLFGGEIGVPIIYEPV